MMPSLDLIFTLLMLPAVLLLAASMVVSMLENKRENLLMTEQSRNH
jgi:hypothetical protein